jgi:DNA helicase-2/ATP-dependent DNA helicase PcrA
MFLTAWDEDLDDAQLAAVEHGDTPLAIIAGAGTGKTRTLVARVTRLLERGVQPERILLLTFTRRAADDMLARASALAGHSELAGRLRGGTFHAVAHQLVSAFAEVLGLHAGFSVLDPADAADVMDLMRDEHGLSGRDERAPKATTLVDIYSRCVNTTKPLAEVISVDFPWCEAHTAAIAELCKDYVTRKRSRQQLDFDDLLLYWRAALLDGALGQHMSTMFDHVLVDEYQDVNMLQVDIVRRLRPDGRGLTVVGDDAQAIYGFRGSDAAHLHELAASLPGTEVIRLQRNFRSFQPILDLANRSRPAYGGVRLVLSASRAGGRRPTLLRCHDSSHEARAVVDRVLERHDSGLRLRDQAVLARAAHHSDLIELELTARRVPYRKYGGLRYIEAAHVKDFVAAVRLLDNPADDIAWYRILRLHEGVGPARARQLLETLPPRRPRAVTEWEETVANAPPPARMALSNTLAGLTAARSEALVAARSEIVLGVLRPLISGRYTDAPARLNDLERLGSAAAAAGDLDSWLAEITLDPPASTGDYAHPPHLDEDYVVVSTVHSAKGLEWPIVHLVNLVDGAFPSDMALRTPKGLEEEHRLFYVAITRARDELFLYSPLRMPYHRHARDDRHGFAQASRWLSEDVMSALKVEELAPSRPRVHVGGTAGDQVGTSAAVEQALDLDSLWR